MGEYADYYFRQEMRNQFGFDPGEGCLDAPERPPKAKRVNCKLCGKYVAEIGLDQHCKDKHGEK